MRILLYADPGAGALLWQLLLAVFFGGMFYFSRIRNWFRTRFIGKNKTEQISEETSTNKTN